MAARAKSPRRRGSASDKPKFDVYQAVTDKIVAALEEGVVPWRKPWRAVGEGVQRNVVSKRPYRGVNQMLLGLTEFESPWWITFNAMKERGGQIKPEAAKKNGGPGPELVVFWSNVRCTTCTDKDGNVIEKSCERCHGRRRFFLLRWFTVWNVEQVDGLPDGLVPPPPELPEDFGPVETAEVLLADYVPTLLGGIKSGGDRACYSPPTDQVRMPRSGAFDAPEHYYGALFHELVHSTGNEKRLARPELCELRSTFGSEPYAREELVAEVGASMLSAMSGCVTPELDENAAAYIGNWLTKLKDDKRLIVGASAQAQRAVDLIVGTTFEDAEPTNGKVD